jgi:hypothetical protein
MSLLYLDFAWFAPECVPPGFAYGTHMGVGRCRTHCAPPGKNGCALGSQHQALRLNQVQWTNKRLDAIARGRREWRDCMAEISDEDKLIRVLQLHKALKQWVMGILREQGIACQETYGNDENGDII